jgi:gas vesicle protein
MSNFSKGVAWFIGGAIAGAAVTLLLTPEQREEIRKELSELKAETAKRTQEYCEQLKQEIKHCKEQVANADPEKEV